MEKKNIDWSNLGFSYLKTDYRYVSNYKDGAWDEGAMITDDTVTISECAGVLQYAQTVFEEYRTIFRRIYSLVVYPLFECVGDYE